MRNNSLSFRRRHRGVFWDVNRNQQDYGPARELDGLGSCVQNCSARNIEVRALFILLQCSEVKENRRLLPLTDALHRIIQADLLSMSPKIEMGEVALLQCAIIDDYQSCALGLADWSSLPDFQVQSFDDHVDDPAALVERLAPFDVIVAMRERTAFDAALLGALPRLKLLVTSGMRNAAIDVAAAKGRGVVVSGTGGLPNVAPELSWGLLMALARHIAAEAESLRHDGPWQTWLGIGLAGKTLGIIGLGGIGGRMARYAQAFDMPVLAWSPNLTDERCHAAGVERAADLGSLLRRGDIVTLHMVLSDRTRGMIGAPELALMKPSALLINTSRGPLIDEAALIQTLAEQRIAGAALDVFDVEPLPPGHPFRTLPNVLATPHIGYVSRESYAGYFEGAVENIAAWMRGAPIRTL